MIGTVPSWLMVAKIGAPGPASQTAESESRSLGSPEESYGKFDEDWHHAEESRVRRELRRFGRNPLIAMPAAPCSPSQEMTVVKRRTFFIPINEIASNDLSARSIGRQSRSPISALNPGFPFNDTFIVRPGPTNLAS
ncbi:hypothetical protein HPP92_005823 [Vanilla planifolia]|uniref:Uncharacterized protein n=1 Tax=Vanilla planifolia TaxID=51239 RepID=A0A835VBR1_VANPL|nr:hypothetical protein HPP92_005823 [Vanilla planifolia]